jgi:hypothetical protein
MKRGNGIKRRDDRSSGIEILMPMRGCGDTILFLSETPRIKNVTLIP